MQACSEQWSDDTRRDIATHAVSATASAMRNWVCALRGHVIKRPAAARTFTAEVKTCPQLHSCDLLPTTREHCGQIFPLLGFGPSTSSCSATVANATTVGQA